MFKIIKYQQLYNKLAKTAKTEGISC